MTKLAPYNWLRQVPGNFKNLESAPLFGNPPPFDFSLLASALSQALSLENVEIKTKPLEFKEAAHIRTGYEEAEVLYFQVSPLTGTAAILVPHQNFNILLGAFADKEHHHALVDEEFKKSFTHFIALELLNAFQNAFPDKNLIPQYKEQGYLSEEGLWAQEVELHWNNEIMVFRLVFPEEMRMSWKERYAEKSLEIPSAILSAVKLDVHVQVGRTELSRREFKTLSKGDFLVLDRCQITPGEDKGRVLLTINQVPAYRAMIKNGSIKILETPQFNEIGTPMANDPQEEEEEVVEDDIEETSDDDYDEDDEEFSEEEGEEGESTEITPGISHAMFKTDDIPLDIVVEVGRFQMTVQKLSELQPGTVVDLEIYPENGVDLVINGSCVAKGELLKVGDTLGVRILDIAK